MSCVYESTVVMKVIVRGIGDLKEYFGKEPRELVVAENANVKALLVCIEQQWGAGFPAYLWDYNKHQFRGPIFLVVNKKVIQDPNSQLEDGVEISIVRAVAGG
jgi:molybdopterin converting factor small subunit